MTKTFHQSNRQNLADKLPANAYVILFAGGLTPKLGDQFFPFEPRRNFWYATGITAPKVIFTLYKDKNGKINEHLFIERFDEVSAKWVGCTLSEAEAKDASGVEKVMFIDEFEQTAANALFGNSPEVYLDLECRSFKAPMSEDLKFANLIRERFPALPIRDVYPLFAELRAIKTADEVSEIKKAVEAAKHGIYAIMKKARPGIKENELEAAFNYELQTRGMAPSFNSIVAGESRAAVLHYENNDGIISGGLVLCDLGAKSGVHCCDISRTFPVSGKFTDRENLLYEIVLEANQKVIGLIKPGIAFKALNEAVIEHYSVKLKEIGLISDKKDIEKYYYHGVSHPLGLEVHDIGRGTFDTLAKGMVLTVEPGLYIADEGIGIRIEDNILVTEHGCENLSADIIKTVSEIEDYMRER
jgi:Xaa-Pro aminopeptidase